MKEIKMDYQTYERELAHEWRQGQQDFINRLIKFMKSDMTTNAAWDIFVEDERIYNPDSDLHKILSQLAGIFGLYSRDQPKEIKNET